MAREKTGDGGEFRFAESAALFSAADKRILMVCVTCDGFARAFRESTVEKGQQVVLDVVVEKPAIALIHVCDDAGRPVGDARVRRLLVRGRNGELNVRLDDFERFGMKPVASDELGRLKLPELPEGTVADAVIEHADLAAAEVKDIRIGDGVIAEAVLKPGVPVLVHIVASEQGDRVSQVAVLLRRMSAGYEHPSVIWFDRLAIQPDGRARITVEAGQYGTFSMYHKDFQSLEGKPAPELDGQVWLNAPRESLRLTDFRGKYVLLDFWTTWCGPCHADFPTIKLLEELYKDRGLTVIGIDDNQFGCARRGPRARRTTGPKLPDRNRHARR